tara:strand:+ start:1431 stop:1793 length:363 start_codon:yes stop_codon:yes gene_type:complete
MKKTRMGKITYMAVNPNRKQFGKYEGTFSYSNPSEIGANDYIMKIQFPENGKEQTFKVIECNHGPDIGHPSQVFANFDKGDKTNVRISNGYRVDRNWTISDFYVYKYPGTTHLDKGPIDY